MTSDRQNIQKLKELLVSYSFDDLAQSFFVLNLWLPNVASPIKSQYLYVLLEEIFGDLAKKNKIKDFADFKIFCDTLLPMLPTFSMLEDYVPEDDWGDIKYFFRDKFFKIFYGGDLSNTYDHYYSFEIIHQGFEKFYMEKIGRSPTRELEFCLSLQDEIINGIDKSTQDKQETHPGDFATPSETFWVATIKFLNNFKPNEHYGTDILNEYSTFTILTLNNSDFY